MSPNKYFQNEVSSILSMASSNVLWENWIMGLYLSIHWELKSGTLEAHIN